MSKKLTQKIAENRIADGTIKPLPLQEQVSGLYDFCCDLLDVLSSGEPLGDFHYQNLMNHLRMKKDISNHDT